METKHLYDYMIIGGGIVGLSTAWQLKKRFPRQHVVLLEKESRPAIHQTGHNSGVIHAGVYYQPGSLKADFCKRGHRLTIAFCNKNQIPYDQCGKLLVATNSVERDRLVKLAERCQTNQIDTRWIDSMELQQLEPNIIGTAALLVRETAIVDYSDVSVKIADKFSRLGGKLAMRHSVVSISEKPSHLEIGVDTPSGKQTIQTKFLIACGGLMADRLTRMQGIPTNFRIIPYRGEYYKLGPHLNNIVNHLIYPVPDPDLPFLGIHLTKMINDGVTVGPNAVQGWKREGYDRVNFSIRDVFEMLSFPGFWKVSKKHLKTGLIETRNSLWKKGYLKEVQKYCPSLNSGDLMPYPAGIRAQAVLQDGSLVHDFLFAESSRSLHVCNAPSPAATSAFPIGEYICDKVEEKKSVIHETP